MSDPIDRQAAIKAFDGEKYDNPFCGEYEVGYNDAIDFAVSTLSDLPSAQPEPLTDKEQRIFLAAMGREEKVCKKVDDEYKDSYENNLVRVCHEITRKVKKALWTN